MPLVPSLFLLLLLHLSCSPTVQLAAADEHKYTLVAMSSLKPKATCSGYRVSPPQNITWVPLNHPHGPCSPLSDAATPSLAELLHHDQLRVDGIHMRLSNDTPGDSKKTQSDQNYQTESYGNVVHAHVGGAGHPPPLKHQGSSQLRRNIDASAAAAGSRSSSLPGVLQTFVLDTASDVPWVQCLPCPIPPCHPQVDSFYDPSRSPSSAPFSCTSPTCTGLGTYANGCVNNQCQYRVVYPDGTSTSGSYIADLLTFDASNAVPSFKFGCSHAEQGSFDSRAAGILALGGGPESLLSQTASRYGKVFAYCIPASSSYSGFFILGVPSLASSRYVVTPMVRFSQATFYGVRLRAITVGGQPLGVGPTVFAAGSVLDSRTDITRLPPTAYQALRAAFRSSMSMYRSAPPKGILDTCYDFTGVVNIKLPKITLVFDRNAVVVLDSSGILFHDCLAFASNANDRMPGILGSVQQQTIEVLYNVDGGTVGFRQGAC
ncbi:aspartyl protease family protein At5g10770-like [Panicum virgatum]|uniref:Peptidase A1 domain-containing protein n=2 Tax=Panicum virgatum TaxID=38727 RepID=A0A8T0RDL5_PANVG|nr:aspartyl protease family protein At5g10770-like [Panicum virgatum]XP_039853803.1 aspartyl protease family protein At5g10770-like [Panicum virgatum]KAG2583280.1 hypothetical protein PVAP13_6KG166818 [Panicum virgatum]KAG2583296.1 hypothetical protein PVAP13_6KG125900 [Panicum virgatum]